MGILAAAPVIQAAAPIAQAGLNVAGGLFSNRTNKKIARETNALNYKMFQEANEYNTQMWNLANEYNLPKNQVQRLIDAGINPAAAIDAPQLGAAQSAPSSVAAPTMQGYQYQNPFANIGNDLVSFTQAMKNAQEAKNVDLQNKNYEWKLTEEIDLMRKQGMLSQQQVDSLKQDYDLKEVSWDFLMKEIQQRAYLTQEQAGIAHMQHELLMTYGAAKEEANLDMICAQAYNAIQDGNYKKAAKELTQADISYKQAMVFIEQYRAKTERIVGEATALNQRVQALGHQIENDIQKQFGRGVAASNLIETWTRTSNMIKDGKIKDIHGVLLELEKDLRTFGPNQRAQAMGIWLRNVIPIFGSTQSITNALPLFGE